MNNDNRKKIAVVARTIGLEYDDRIRKECIALSKKADIFIYVNFEDNRQIEGVTSYGIPFKSFRLITREKLPSSKYLLIKSLDFYLRIYKYLRNYDLIWAHEEYSFMFPLLAKRNKCIWDLHEIPFRFERKWMKSVFHFIEERSRKIIHANNYRIAYMKKKGVIKYYSKHDFLRNFPDRQFADSTNVDPNYEKFKDWLNGSDYAYLQGLSLPKRHPINSIEAILKTKSLKAVVIGTFDSNAHKVLRNKYGSELEERVYFAGMVEQLSIPAYIKKAVFSIVLYDTNTPNNRYCEPNRLYQSITMGVPVIVGCNEPMKSIVDLHEFGVSLTTDGKDLEELLIAVSTILKNRSVYLKKIEKSQEKIIWDDQNIKEDWYA